MKYFSRSGPVAVVVDLGGTRVRAALADREGRPGARHERATDRRSPAAFIDGVAGLIREVLDAAYPPGAEGFATVPVIVGTTGPVDAEGCLTDPPNLEPAFRGLPLRAGLEAAMGRRVLVGLDTHLALLGERSAGALQGVDDGLYLTFSTGVGGAVLAGGQLVMGAGRMAGEVGHLPVTATGPRCGCGVRGHLEAWSAGPAIGAAATRYAARMPSSVLAGRVAVLARHPTGAEVGAWARDGDPGAMAVLRKARAAAAVGVAALVALLDPARVVLGGGAVLAEPQPWIAACRDRLDRVGLAAQRGRVDVVAAALGDDAALHGGVPFARLTRPGLVPGR